MNPYEYNVSKETGIPNDFFKADLVRLINEMVDDLEKNMYLSNDAKHYIKEKVEWDVLSEYTWLTYDPLKSNIDVYFRELIRKLITNRIYKFAREESM